MAMALCKKHWADLRAEIEQRGLTPFVAKNGTVAAAQMMKEFQNKTSTKETFDPLLSSYWAVLGNCMTYLQNAGAGPLYFLSDGPEDPLDPARVRPEYKNRTWPKCPLCYLNLAHEMSCTNPKCVLPKIDGYDWMLGRATDDVLEQAREYGLVP